MHRWTLTSLLAAAAGLAAWLAPRAFDPPPTVPDGRSAHRDPLPVVGDADGPLDLDLSLDAGAVLRDDPTTRYLVATVRAPTVTGGQRAPVDLALVLDVSGSMAAADKIDQARRAAGALVESLGGEDRVALVSFEDRAHRLAPLGSPNGRLLDLVASLEPGGGTNLSDGLLTGFEQLRGDGARVRKLILMTDGQANQGITGVDALAGLARSPSITVSTVGVGYDYNELLLARMADAGGGAYHYVDASTSLATVFEREFDAAARLVATHTRLELDLGPGVTATRVLGWEGEVEAGHVGVDLGSLAGGVARTVVVEVRVEPGADAERAIARATLTGTAAASASAFSEHADARATVVRTPGEVADRVSTEAMTAATNAVAGEAAVAANAAFRDGDVDRGRRQLKEAAGWIRRQSADYDLAIPEANAAQLEALGYAEPAEAQKQTLSQGRGLSRGGAW